jgi:hypothetical protein
MALTKTYFVHTTRVVSRCLLSGTKILRQNDSKAGYTTRLCYSGDDGKKFEAISGQQSAGSGQQSAARHLSGMPIEIATDAVGINGDSR